MPQQHRPRVVAALYPSKNVPQSHQTQVVPPEINPLNAANEVGEMVKASWPVGHCSWVDPQNRNEYYVIKTRTFVAMKLINIGSEDGFIALHREVAAMMLKGRMDLDPQALSNFSQGAELWSSDHSLTRSRQYMNAICTTANLAKGST